MSWLTRFERLAMGSRLFSGSEPVPVCSKSRSLCVERFAHKRFTLIELLVVVAIIAVLAALLLPALGQARIRAKLVQCMGNQKQVAVLVMVYQDDYDGYYPSHSWWTTMETYSAGAYLPVKHCPIEAVTDYGPFKPGAKPGWGYQLNVDLASSDGWAVWGKTPRLTDIRWSDQTMMLSDGSWRGPTFPHRNDYAEQTFFGRGSPYASPAHLTAAQMSRGINITYVDGHVAFMKSFNPVSITEARTDRRYPFNYKRFWGRKGTQSWNLAPYLN